jgi:hypothetical protein
MRRKSFLPGVAIGVALIWGAVELVALQWCKVKERFSPVSHRAF